MKMTTITRRMNSQKRQPGFPIRDLFLLFAIGSNIDFVKVIVKANRA